MSDATQNPTLEQTLNKTDFGHMIYENRKAFLGLLLAVLVGVTGYLIWKQTKHSSALEDSVKVFEFQSGIWTDVKAGKTGVPELVKAFESLDQAVRTAPVMVPVALEMGKFLYDQGAFTEAETILSQAGESKHALTQFFLGMQRSVVLEKLGKTDEAIAVLESLAKVKDGLMPAKVSLELGRLYMQKGDKAQAQTQFDFVVSTYPNEEQAKLAKLFLAELAR